LLRASAFGLRLENLTPNALTGTKSRDIAGFGIRNA
jgi:hypothetical protein